MNPEHLLPVKPVPMPDREQITGGFLLGLWVGIVIGAGFTFVLFIICVR